MKGQNQVRILCERQAAEYLGAISVRTLQDWRARRVGPAFLKLGRRIGYRLNDLDEFISASRVIPTFTGCATASVKGRDEAGAESQ